jgi:nicotinamidase-related amidase
MSQTTALILVDLQVAAFGGLGIPAVYSADRLLGNVRALLKAARETGIPVVHIQHCARPGQVFAEGAPGWPIFPPLRPQGSESVVQKRVSDAFEGTDLHVDLPRFRRHHGYGVMKHEMLVSTAVTGTASSISLAPRRSLIGGRIGG